MSTEEIKELKDTLCAYGKRIEELESVDGGKKKKKDPNAPKRPPSAYNIFVGEQTKIINKESPEMKFGEVSKEISKRWKAHKETLSK